MQGVVGCRVGVAVTRAWVSRWMLYTLLASPPFHFAEGLDFGTRPVTRDMRSLFEETLNLKH